MVPLLPAALSPPAQAQRETLSTLNSPTHQKISTKFIHHPNKNIKNSVVISDFWGPCSTVICLQQRPQTEPYRRARAGQAYVIFPASLLPASNHSQLKGLLEPDVVCPVVDLSSGCLPSLPLNACKNFCNYHTLWQRVSQI